MFGPSYFVWALITNSYVQNYTYQLQGNSVCCHVHGFHPYFFVPAPEKFEKENLRDFRMALNNVVVSDMKNNRDNITDAVLHVEILQKSTIYHFQGNLLKGY